MRFYTRLVGVLLLAALLVPGFSPRAQSVTQVTIDGSSVVQSIVKQATDEFTAKNPGTTFNIQISGTDGGFDKFCAGSLDINMATKGISDAQASACAAKGVNYVETLLGYDAAVLVVARDAKPVCLATDEIAKLLGPGGTAFNNWQQIQTAIGDAAIGKIYAGQGARAANLILSLIPGGTLRTDLQTVKDGAEAISKVTFEATAVAIASYTEFQNAQAEQKAVKALQIKVQNTCTDATEINLELARYPAAQPLYVYTAAASLDKQGVTDFLKYVIGDGKKAVGGQGFITANDTIFTRNLSYLTAKQTGRTFSRIQAVNLPADTAGSILIGGAPEAQPLLKAVADGFNPRYSKITVNTQTFGDEAGFKKLCANGLDLLANSRAATDAEATACKAANVNLTSVTLGASATVIVASAKNTFAPCLTLDQVGKLFGAASSGTVKKWSDVDAKFPATDLLIVAPTGGSAALDLLLLKAVKGTAPLPRYDVVESDDPLYRAAGVANVEGGITYMTYAEFKKANNANARAVQIDAGKGCVAPEDKTILDGSYALSRPYTLQLNQSAFTRAEVKAFVWYLLSDDGLTVLGGQSDWVGLDKEGFTKARDVVLDLFNKAPAPAVATGTPSGTGTPVPTPNFGLNPLVPTPTVAK